MLAREGWHARARTEGLTVLDEAGRRATSIGWTAYYTPITPRDGLRFSADTELMPQVAGTFQLRNSPRSLDWTGDEQHLTSGWVAARVPAHFAVRRSAVDRPEHLAVSRGRDGARTVTNGLGAAVRRLWLADGSGTVHTATDVAAGAAATLEPTALRARGEADGMRRLFASEWTALCETLTGHPEEYLLPGCYVAALDDTPFFEPGLAGVRDRPGRSVVFGILREPADAD
jgi:hypothetical protein